MAYLTAAIVLMTLSVLDLGHFFIASCFQCDFFVNVARRAVPLRLQNLLISFRKKRVCKSYFVSERRF